MQIIEVISREIAVITEFSVSDLKNLNVVLDNMSLEYDGTNPDHVAAHEYLMEVFTPTIKRFLKENGIKTD